MDWLLILAVVAVYFLMRAHFKRKTQQLLDIADKQKQIWLAMTRLLERLDEDND